MAKGNDPLEVLVVVERAPRAHAYGMQVALDEPGQELLLLLALADEVCPPELVLGFALLLVGLSLDIIGEAVLLLLNGKDDVRVVRILLPIRPSLPQRLASAGRMTVAEMLLAVEVLTPLLIQLRGTALARDDRARLVEQPVVLSGQHSQSFPLLEVTAWLRLQLGQ